MGHFTHMLEHDATRGDIWIVKARQLSCCVQHQLSQFTQAWLRRRNFAEVPSAALQSADFTYLSPSFSLRFRKDTISYILQATMMN